MELSKEIVYCLNQSYNKDLIYSMFNFDGFSELNKNLLFDGLESKGYFFMNSIKNDLSRKRNAKKYEQLLQIVPKEWLYELDLKREIDNHIVGPLSLEGFINIFSSDKKTLIEYKDFIRFLLIEYGSKFIPTNEQIDLIYRLNIKSLVSLFKLLRKKTSNKIASEYIVCAIFENLIQINHIKFFTSICNKLMIDIEENGQYLDNSVFIWAYDKFNPVLQYDTMRIDFDMVSKYMIYLLDSIDLYKEFFPYKEDLKILFESLKQTDFSNAISNNYFTKNDCIKIIQKISETYGTTIEININTIADASVIASYLLQND